MARSFKMHPGMAAAVAAAIVFALVLCLPAILDGDSLYWHIMAGRWTIENHAVLRIDPFSYTYAGHPWATQDWLAQVLIALAYIVGNWSGVLVFFALTAAAAAGVVAWHVSRRLAGPALPVVLLASLACAAAGFAARPDILSLPLFAIWTAGLVAAREEKRAPPFHLLPVMVLWANLEPGYVAGLIVLAGFGLESAWRRHAIRRWSVFAGFALIASVMTPYGALGLIHAAGLLARLHYLILFAVAVPLVLAGPLGDALSAPAEPRRLRWTALAVIVVLMAVMATLRFVRPVVRGNDATTPASALAAVPANLARRPVFNERAFGGYLIFKKVRPFIDGRSGLYGQGFLDRYARMVRPDKALLAATLARRHVRWTILAADDPAVKVMDGMAGWHRLYTGRWAVVHVRNDVK